MDTVKSHPVFSSPDFSVTPAELRQLLGRPDTPLVVDLRRLPRFQESPRLLPTARYCQPDKLTEFAAQHQPQAAVVYCVYGHEVSQHSAAWLRAQGQQGPVGTGALPLRPGRRITHTQQT